MPRGEKDQRVPRVRVTSPRGIGPMLRFHLDNSDFLTFFLSCLILKSHMTNPRPTNAQQVLVRSEEIMDQKKDHDSRRGDTNTPSASVPGLPLHQVKIVNCLVLFD